MYVSVTTVIVDSSVTTEAVQASGASSTMAAILGSTSDWATLSTSSFVVAGCEPSSVTQVTGVTRPQSEQVVTGTSGSFALYSAAYPTRASGVTAIILAMHGVTDDVPTDSGVGLPFMTPEQNDEILSYTQHVALILGLVAALFFIVIIIMAVGWWKHWYTLKRVMGSSHSHSSRVWEPRGV